MIRSVLGEAANEPIEGQSAVAHVILNRVASGKWGGNASSVVLAPGQFEPWQTRKAELTAINPNSAAYQNAGQIVDSAADAKTDPTGGATHFLNPQIVMQHYGKLPPWAQGSSLTIGGHRFFAPDNPDYNGPSAAINAAIQQDTIPPSAANAIKAAISPTTNDSADAIKAAIGAQ